MGSDELAPGYGFFFCCLCGLGLILNFFGPQFSQPSNGHKNKTYLSGAWEGQPGGVRVRQGQGLHLCVLGAWHVEKSSVKTIKMENWAHERMSE